MKQIKLLIILLAFSTTLSAQWEQVDSIPVNTSNAEVLISTNNELYYFGPYYIYLLNENDEAFSKIYDTEEFIRFFDIDNQKIYWCEGDFILISDDKCETFDTILNIENGTAYSICVDNNFICVGTSNKIYVSNDYGVTWDEKDKPNYNYEVNSILKRSEGSFLVGCISLSTMKLYETTDNMQTWNLVFSEPIYDGKENFGYHNIYKVGYNEIIYTVFESSSRFLYSFDNGLSFEEVNEFEFIVSYKNINNQTVLIIQVEIGFLEYEYKLAISSGYENFAIYDLPFRATDIEKHNNFLYIVDYQNRVYKTNLANYVRIEENKCNFNINVYPNPVSSIVNIEKENVEKITIFNSSGNIIKQEDNIKNNQVDVSDLSSGVYIINIQTETESISEKIIIE